MALLDPRAVGGMVSWLAEFDRSARWPQHRVDDELVVEIMEHAVATAHGPRVATTFLTRGLEAVGQPEVVFTWTGPSMLGTPSASVIAALRKLGRAAAEGLELRPGICFHLGEGALLDGIGLAGLVLVPAIAMPGVNPPTGALHAIAVTPDELEVAAQTSVLRVISRLGLDRRHFPCSPWSTPRRSVARPGEATVLTSTRRIVIPGLTVAFDRTGLNVRVPRDGAPQLALVIDTPGDGIALVAELDPAADALLAWKPGVPQAAVITARGAGARIAGAFVRISCGDRSSAVPLEDGYALALDRDARRTLSVALASGRGWRTDEVAITIA